MILRALLLTGLITALAGVGMSFTTVGGLGPVPCQLGVTNDGYAKCAGTCPGGTPTCTDEGQTLHFYDATGNGDYIAYCTCDPNGEESVCCHTIAEIDIKTGELTGDLTPDGDCFSWPRPLCPSGGPCARVGIGISAYADCSGE